MSKQATKGGQQGINGSWYEGGQFLPSSESTIKGEYRPVVRAGAKKEIAPYIYEKTPADDMLSIYDRIGCFTNDNRRECTYTREQGFAGLRLTMNPIALQVHGGKNMPAFDAWMRMLVDRWNAGERWYPLSDDPFHWKNNQG